MPNIGPTGLLALLSFPFVCWVIFRRLPAAKATMTATLYAMMFLPDGVPAAFDFPTIPPLGKENMATICCLLLLFGLHRTRFLESRPLRGIEIITLLSMFGLIGTVMQNQETLTYGRLAGEVPGAVYTVLPPIRFYDTLAQVVLDTLKMVVPFIVGRVAFRSRKDLRTVCHVFVAFGLIYVPFMLIELRLSPMLHIWIYGYFPHTDFTQTIKYGGFRPQVFLEHGLSLARLQVMVFLAALALWLGGEPRAWRLESRVAVAVMLFVVLLTKSMGAIVLMLTFALLFFLGSMKTQSRVMAVVALLVFLYPVGRATGTLDLQPVLKVLERYVPERAASLAYRIRNEDEIGERARQKFIFGWGGYSRSHVIDPELGHDRSVTDGYWLIRFSNFGLLGLVGPYTILLGPVFLVWLRSSRIPFRSDRQMVIVIGGMSLIYAIESLPNAFSTNLPFLMAGAVWGLVTTLSDPEYIRKERLKRARWGRRDGWSRMSAGTPPAGVAWAPGSPPSVRAGPSAPQASIRRCSPP